MKIYEKPLVDIKTFDVEDVMTTSGEYSENNELFDAIVGNSEHGYSGVVFQW